MSGTFPIGPSSQPSPPITSSSSDQKIERSSVSSQATKISSLDSRHSTPLRTRLSSPNIRTPLSSPNIGVQRNAFSADFSDFAQAGAQAVRRFYSQSSVEDLSDEESSEVEDGDDKWSNWDYEESTLFLSPEKQAELWETQKAEIQQLFEAELKAHMAQTGQPSVKISRRVKDFTHSYTVTKEGAIFRHLHASYKKIRVDNEEMEIIPQGKKVGRGGVKVASAIVEVHAQAPQVLAAVKSKLKASEGAIEAAKVFRNNPRLAPGYYVTWKSHKRDIQKEGFITERMQMNLLSLLESGSLTRETKISIMYQVAQALRDVHQEGWAHLDVKAENIFMSPDPAQQGQYVIKLADFDNALKIGQSVPNLGSPTYIAPEVLKGECQDPQKADIFSLGVLFNEIFNKSFVTSVADDLGEQLDWMKNLTYEKLADEGLLEPAENTLEHFIWEMMNPTDPARRPTIQEVLTQLPLLK